MVGEKAKKILYIGTHAGEDPERACMPFVMANAALAMDIKATVVLQGHGVYVAKKGYVDNMLPGGGFPEMKDPGHGWNKSNINILTDNDPEGYDVAMGSTNLRVLMCKIYPVEDE